MSTGAPTRSQRNRDGALANTRERLRHRLDRVRQRTLALIEPLGREKLFEQPDVVMGVPAWDVGHIGAFEELWLVENLDQGETSLSRLGSLFDPLVHPRSERGELELPTRDELLAYLQRTRKRALARLDTVDLEEGDRLVRDGFVHDLIVRHEQQHQENLLIACQLMGRVEDGGVVDAYEPGRRHPTPEAQVSVDGMVEVPGGTYRVGTARWVGAYDNERPPHPVELAPYRIDRAPVTVGEFLAFMDDGGYQDRAHWSEDGWLIKEALDWAHPRSWHQTPDGGWHQRTFDRLEPLALDQPVAHVSAFEADAYAAWAGKRLPTEAEWEVAAAWDPETDTMRRYPWGDEPWTPQRANLDQRLFGQAPVGAYPDGASAIGCHQMVGDVWEWTGTVFSGYPGFEPYPYPEYSQQHFGKGHRVLRGGSWATWPDCATTTFRNWHQEDHQHLFAGFRCVEEVEA